MSGSGSGPAKFPLSPPLARVQFFDRDTGYLTLTGLDLFTKLFNGIQGSGGVLDLMTDAAHITTGNLDIARLPIIGTHLLLANLTPSDAAPQAVTTSAILDLSLGNAAGDLAMRGVSVWGVLPSPGDATKFLSGASPPAYEQVKDSDLSLSDITTNDVSVTEHGFAPKAPGDATKYLDGEGGYSTPAGGVGANPTATASDTAVDGVAATFMRSDAAPPVQKASGSQFGLVKVDGTTITEVGGVISSYGGAALNGFPGLHVQQISDGAVHQYRLDEISGSAAIDRGSSPSNGTYTSVTLGSAPISADVAHSAVFDGTSSHLDLTFKDPPADPTTGAWTMEWVVRSDNAAYHGRRIIANDHTDSTGLGFQCSSFSGSDVAFTTTGAYPDITPLNDQKIHLVAWVYTGTVDNHFYSYVDAVLVRTDNVAGNYIGGGYNIGIGYNPAYSGDWWQGAMSNLAYFNKALTAAQLAAHFAGIGLPVYANNAAALAGGLTFGAFFRLGGDPDQVCVVH